MLLHTYSQRASTLDLSGLSYKVKLQVEICLSTYVLGFQLSGSAKSSSRFFHPSYVLYDGNFKQRVKLRGKLTEYKPPLGSWAFYCSYDLVHSKFGHLCRLRWVNLVLSLLAMAWERLNMLNSVPISLMWCLNLHLSPYLDIRLHPSSWVSPCGGLSFDVDRQTFDLFSCTAAFLINGLYYCPQKRKVWHCPCCQGRITCWHAVLVAACLHQLLQITVPAA